MPSIVKSTYAGGYTQRTICPLSVPQSSHRAVPVSVFVPKFRISNLPRVSFLRLHNKLPTNPDSFKRPSFGRVEPIGNGLAAPFSVFLPVYDQPAWVLPRIIPVQTIRYLLLSYLEMSQATMQRASPLPTSPPPFSLLPTSHGNHRRLVSPLKRSAQTPFSAPPYGSLLEARLFSSAEISPPWLWRKSEGFQC